MSKHIFFLFIYFIFVFSCSKEKNKVEIILDQQDIEEEMIVTDKGCQVITLFPAEEMPIANKY